MIIKKYIGKTEEEAVTLAKAELGENVVIMNVKNAPKKGFFKFLKKAYVEVTVAKEEESERYSYSATGQRSREEASLRETFRQVAEAAKRDEEKKEQQQPENRVKEGGPENRRKEDNQENRRKEDNQEDRRKEDKRQNMLVEKLDSLQNMIEKTLQTSGELSEKEQELDVEEQRENTEMARFMTLLYETMIDNEVREKYAGQLVDEVKRSVKPNMPFDYALGDVYQKMILQFGKPMPIEKGGRKPRVVFFIGPTGVGKTTTIAKLASRFRVDNGLKVALLTADTYRIAAAEQLRTYANILEIPFRVIYSSDEMEAALRDFRDYDFIMVDTAGHSHQNTAQKENMSAFVHSLDEFAEKEVHLVLSATTKYRDLLSIADAYSDITDYKIIFTKLDETTTLGNLLNLKLYTGASLSYVTYGQNVPDDIEIFDPQKTVKMLLGGKN